MSLINDALKRATEAQNETAQRPRAPKGVEASPAPMTPTAACERPKWLPVLGVGLLIATLLGASGFFFANWWKQRQDWKPFAETPSKDIPTANTAAKGTPPPDPKQTRIAAKEPPAPNLPTVPKPVVTAAILPPPKPPDVVAPPPVVPPPSPLPIVAAVEKNPAPAPPHAIKPSPQVTPDTSKKVDPPVTQVPAVEFPDLKLQGISRGKNKTFVTVNGKTLALGDHIQGVTLLKIDADSVTVEKSGAKRELFLLR